MRHFLAIQTAASLLVLSIIAMAELAAFLLDRFPASTLLWYLNQDIFRFIENSRHLLTSPAHLWINKTTLYWDLALIVAVLFIHRARWRFGTALMSHACLYFVGLLAYDWAIALRWPRTASLEPVMAAFGQSNGAVLLFATGAALISAILAHLTYLSGICSSWQRHADD